MIVLGDDVICDDCCYWSKKIVK